MTDILYLLAVPVVAMLMTAGVIWHSKRQANASLRARLRSRPETTLSVAPADVIRAERDRA
ncbi:hypothetical protein SR870_15175 [Rhodopseudomonas palustris]|uniref:hypothetical protein n=1 Tax=Rhodopseudomonas palustris TaxID=1076 RepID=UPI002ACD2B6E|nr:hypothetical protein [Rhodopseudomonas palustris]WQG98042.1 hypothetical protein SR870_15175 [Rhodopseudomonas palustris]